jgi:hypothetical protein
MSPFLYLLDSASQYLRTNQTERQQSAFEETAEPSCGG